MWYLHTNYSEQIGTTLKALSVIITLASVICLLFGVWYLSEKMRMIRATRIEMEKNAHIFTMRAGKQVFIRDTNTKATWKALHLQPNFLINGSPTTETTPQEMENWRIFNKAPNGTTPSKYPLENTTAPQHILDSLSNSQRALIKGVSDAGKTTLFQWLVHHKLSDSQVIVIDPHASPNKWPGCQVIGAGSNHKEIEKTLDSLVTLMIERYQQIARGEYKENSHPRLTIIIDEWMSIVYECNNAKKVVIKLLTESRKAAFSLYIGSHSDRVASLGLDGRGDLKQGFTMVRLYYDGNERQATIDHGRGEQPALLPGPYLPTLSNASSTLIELPQAQPNEQEKKILEMREQGLSFNKISLAVYGSKGGQQNKQIKQVLSKYGV